MDDSPAVPGLGLTDLRAALSSTDPTRRAAAISRVRAEPGVEELVISALRDGHERVRRAAVLTLGRLGGEAATRALVAACSRDVSPVVRAEAVAALGKVLARSSGDPPSDLQPQ